MARRVTDRQKEFLSLFTVLGVLGRAALGERRLQTWRPQEASPPWGPLLFLPHTAGCFNSLWRGCGFWGGPPANTVEGRAGQTLAGSEGLALVASTERATDPFSTQPEGKPTFGFQRATVGVVCLSRPQCSRDREAGLGLGCQHPERRASGAAGPNGRAVLAPQALGSLPGGTSHPQQELRPREVTAAVWLTPVQGAGLQLQPR